MPPTTRTVVHRRVLIFFTKYYLKSYTFRIVEDAECFVKGSKVMRRQSELDYISNKVYKHIVTKFVQRMG
jgi:hypothetical protein